jgi:RNA polymerase sigma factor (sigma-70 family)
MDRSDSELVAACRRGDEEAWQVLVLRYQRLIYTIPIRAGLDTDTAAEVFQFVFTKLYQSLPTIDRGDRIRAWLVTTAKRETIRLVQQAAKVPAQVSTEDEVALETPDNLPLPVEVLQKLEEEHMVRAALEQIGERCRTLLTLLYFQETPPTYMEIAAALGIPVGSIGPYRARCLQQIRTRLLESGF